MNILEKKIQLDLNLQIQLIEYERPSKHVNFKHFLKQIRSLYGCLRVRRASISRDTMTTKQN